MFTHTHKKDAWTVEVEIGRFGRLVRMWRLNRGMSQEKLAALIGVSRTTIYRIENGKNIPAAPVWIVLCLLMDVDPRNFLWGDGGFCGMLYPFRPDLAEVE